MSTGSLTSAPLGPGDTCPSSYTTDVYDAYTATYCGADSYNGASYLLNIIATKATTLLIDMVIASCDLTSGDKVLILIDGVNYAKDENRVALDSSSKYLSEPWGIPAPNGDTAFAMSSPPLRFSIPILTPSIQLRIAVCDRLDGYGDTAVMIKAKPCNNCDQPFKVNYETTSITSTTTFEAISTFTQPASGTLGGTISLHLINISSNNHNNYFIRLTTLYLIRVYSLNRINKFNIISDIYTYHHIYRIRYCLTRFYFIRFHILSSIVNLDIFSDIYINRSISLARHYSIWLYLLRFIDNFDIDDILRLLHIILHCITCNSVDIATCLRSNGQSLSSFNRCEAAFLDRTQSLCYLMDGSEGPTFNNLYDMATLYSPGSSAAVSSTSSFSDTISETVSYWNSTTISSTSSSPPTPLSCSQMAGNIYTGLHENKFAISCDTVATDESIYRRAKEDSMEGCLTICDDDVSTPIIIYVDIVGVYTCGIDIIYNYINCDLSSIGSIVRNYIGQYLSSIEKIIITFYLIYIIRPYIEIVFVRIRNNYNDRRLYISVAFVTYFINNAIVRICYINNFVSSQESTEITSTTAADVLHTTTSIQTSTPETLTVKTPTTDVPTGETSTTTISATAIIPISAESLLSSISYDSTEIQSTRSAIQSSEVSTLTSTPSSHPASSQITRIMAYETTSMSDVLSTYSTTGYSSSISSFTTIGLGSKTLSVSNSNFTKTISASHLPTTFVDPTAIHIAYSSLTAGHAYTTTQFAEIVTTVTYTTIDPSSPAALITTCVPITLSYTPCKCEKQVYPVVDMTTVVYTQGQSTISLTVPKSAYETGSQSRAHPSVSPPSGWTESYQTDAASNRYQVAQPTAGTHRGYQSDSKYDHSETPDTSSGPQGYSQPSHKNHQSEIPDTASGLRGNHQKEQGDTQPFVTAKGTSLSNNDTLLRPTQPSLSKALISDTSITPTPEFDTLKSSSPSSTFSPGQGSAEHKAPHTTQVVVSAGQRYHFSLWIIIFATMEMLLL
ncbi:hypothetical protein FGRMN_3489 [Fusarium graminum]|nr:hypothetical protein FGRMN_3489 [Fusarium graminum]